MEPATSKQLADRDPLVGALGWRAVLLYGDPCTFDRWAWVHRRSLGGPVRTLDAGSGNGAFAMYAASRGNEVTALSYLEDDQAKARRRATAVGLPEIDFRVGDLRELDRLSVDLGQFDQVFCLEVIEHILDDRKVLRDLAAVIRPGGRLLLTTPYRHHVPVLRRADLDHEDGHHLRVGYTHEEMEAMLVEAGFQAARQQLRQRTHVPGGLQPDVPAEPRLPTPRLGRQPALPAAAADRWARHARHRLPPPVHRSGRDPRVTPGWISERAAPVRRLLVRGLVRAGIVTYVFSGLTLVTNLVTGVVMARALGPDGRGIAFALVTVSQLAGFLFAMGVAQSLSFFIARRPEEAPDLLAPGS